MVLGGSSTTKLGYSILLIKHPHLHATMPQRVTKFILVLRFPFSVAIASSDSAVC